MKPTEGQNNHRQPRVSERGHLKDKGNGAPRRPKRTRPQSGSRHRGHNEAKPTRPQRDHSHRGHTRNSKRGNQRPKGTRPARKTANTATQRPNQEANATGANWRLTPRNSTETGARIGTHGADPQEDTANMANRTWPPRGHRKRDHTGAKTNAAT